MVCFGYTGIAPPPPPSPPVAVMTISGGAFKSSMFSNDTTIQLNIITTISGVVRITMDGNQVGTPLLAAGYNEIPIFPVDTTVNHQFCVEPI